MKFRNHLIFAENTVIPFFCGVVIVGVIVVVIGVDFLQICDIFFNFAYYIYSRLYGGTCVFDFC